MQGIQTILLTIEEKIEDILVTNIDCKKSLAIEYISINSGLDL